MLKKFSNHWKGSSQPRKQRKYVANAPLHIKRKMVSSHLSKELRTKYGKRSAVVRKDDIVKVMLGEFKGKSGKVVSVNLTKMKLIIEGLQTPYIIPIILGHLLFYLNIEFQPFYNNNIEKNLNLIS